MDANLQKIAGRYTLTSLLGKGGMGSVYLAHDEILDRTVAIKALTNLGSENSDRKQIALTEAKTLAQFNHPGILKIYDVLHEAEKIWLVTELVKGKNLAEFPISFSLEVNFAIALQIAEALRIIHEKNIFHRDLKPQNILIADDGRVVLIDFGVAYTAGSTGETLAGSLNYIDPEILAGKGAFAASDLFSFGLVWLELLTGKKVVPDLAPLPLYQYFGTQFQEHVEELCEGLLPPFRSCIEFLLRLESRTTNNLESSETLKSTRDLSIFLNNFWHEWTSHSPSEIVHKGLFTPSSSPRPKTNFLKFLNSLSKHHLQNSELSLRQKSMWLEFASKNNMLDIDEQRKIEDLDTSLEQNRSTASSKPPRKLLSYVKPINTQVYSLLVFFSLFAIGFVLVYGYFFSHTIPNGAGKNANTVEGISEEISAQNSFSEPSEANLTHPQNPEAQTIAGKENGRRRVEPVNSPFPLGDVTGVLKSKGPSEQNNKVLQNEHSQTPTKSDSTVPGVIPECHVRIAANAWADLKINGKPLGRIPRAEPFLLKAGVYTINFSSPFIRSMDKKLKLCENKDVNIYVELTHKIPAPPKVTTQGTPK